MTLGPDIASSWGNVKWNFGFLWVSYYLSYSHPFLLHWPAQFPWNLWLTCLHLLPLISHHSQGWKANMSALTQELRGNLPMSQFSPHLEMNKPQSILTSHYTFTDIFIHSTNMFDCLPYWDSNIKCHGPASKLLSHTTDRNKPNNVFSDKICVCSNRGTESSMA